MVPVTLQYHFETNQSKYKEKEIEYFKLRSDKLFLKANKTFFTTLQYTEKYYNMT